jgi:hypothetical protein
MGEHSSYFDLRQPGWLLPVATVRPQSRQEFLRWAGIGNQMLPKSIMYKVQRLAFNCDRVLANKQ